jgi:hypothetical protein
MEAMMTIQTPLHAEHQLDQLAGRVPAASG